MWIASIAWTLIKSIFGWGKDKATSKENVRLKKENIERKAENAGLRVRQKVEKRQEKIDREWNDANEKDDKYDVIKRGLNDSD